MVMIGDRYLSDLVLGSGPRDKYFSFSTVEVKFDYIMANRDLKELREMLQKTFSARKVRLFQTFSYLCNRLTDKSKRLWQH